jgi:hypothetical protein
VTTAIVAVTFLLMIVWFVWSLVSPPVLRVPPELRRDPIPRNYGVIERPPARSPLAPTATPTAPGRDTIPHPTVPPSAAPDPAPGP